MRRRGGRRDDNGGLIRARGLVAQTQRGCAGGLRGGLARSDRQVVQQQRIRRPLAYGPAIDVQRAAQVAGVLQRPCIGRLKYRSVGMRRCERFQRWQGRVRTMRRDGRQRVLELVPRLNFRRRIGSAGSGIRG